MTTPFIVHINQARSGETHPEELPSYRLVRSCVDIHGYPQCMGAAAMGPERCTCDTLTPEEHEQCLGDAWSDFHARGGDMCRDCAFRKGSPEEESLAKIASEPTPFRCHQGMPVDARSGAPIKDAYAPVLIRNAQGGIESPNYPICAGWKRAHEALARRAPCP
jgi:hypothetical protein